MLVPRKRQQRSLDNTGIIIINNNIYGVRTKNDEMFSKYAVDTVDANSESYSELEDVDIQQCFCLPLQK